MLKTYDEVVVGNIEIIEAFDEGSLHAIIAQKRMMNADPVRKGRMNMVLPRKVTSISYILKIIVIASAVLGTILSAAGGRAKFMGGKVVFMYFTIQSNIAIAVICAIGMVLMLRRARVGRAWYIIKLVGTVSLTLTGVVFCFVLAPTMKSAAWNIQNTLTHVIVPVGAVADFIVTAPFVPVDLKGRDVLFVTVPPLLYTVYAAIGYVCGWQFSPGYNYPYFFLNWGSKAGVFGFSDQLPFMGTGWWIMALLLLLILVGYLYMAVVRLIRRRWQTQNNDSFLHSKG